MAEMNLLQENLSEEKDIYCVKSRLKKNWLKSNQRIVNLKKTVLEDGVGQLEAQIVEMESKLAENAAEISQVQRVIAKTVVEGACNAN